MRRDTRSLRKSERTSAIALDVNDVGSGDIENGVVCRVSCLSL